MQFLIDTSAVFNAVSTVILALIGLVTLLESRKNRKRQVFDAFIAHLNELWVRASYGPKVGHVSTYPPVFERTLQYLSKKDRDNIAARYGNFIGQLMEGMDKLDADTRADHFSHTSGEIHLIAEILYKY